MSAQGQDSMPAPSRAVRLMFTYEGNDVRLVSQQTLDMIIPPTDALSGYEDEQGFWVEVRTARDEVLYRQVMRDPFRQDVEVFSPDPNAVHSPSTGGKAIGHLHPPGPSDRRIRPCRLDAQRGDRHGRR